MRIYALIFAIFCFGLASCDTHAVVQPKDAPYPGLDSLQIFGPDTVFLGEKAVFHVKTYGLLPSYYAYEWTVVDTPSQYQFVTLRDSCEYIAANIGAKTVVLLLRDLRDSTTFRVEKGFFVTKVNSGHVVEQLKDIHFEFLVEVQVERTDGTFIDKTYKKLALTFPLTTKIEVRADTLIYTLKERTGESSDYHETKTEKLGELRFLTSRTGDSLYYFDVKYFETSTTSRRVNNLLEYETEELEFTISTEQLSSTKVTEGTGSKTIEFILSGTQAIQLLSKFEYRSCDGSYSPYGIQYKLLSPIAYKGTPTLVLRAQYIIN